MCDLSYAIPRHGLAVTQQPQQPGYAITQGSEVFDGRNTNASMNNHERSYIQRGDLIKGETGILHVEGKEMDGQTSKRVQYSGTLISPLGMDTVLGYRLNF
ncbi:unnamed protein product [Cylicostephanus goldi]|uniref:Uncharacterized protein n=1 Tax=Cylicostephanus goldi TaxID=71465 RepID=A0A3P6Q5G2_CYLGO|nr:unnamed protein product [Cylicostephanus goldi]